MSEKTNNVKIEDKAFCFAQKIIEFVLVLPGNELKFVLGKQLMRAGTAIGANVEEAKGGLSRRDFIHSMNIAKKEARETLYWLRLLAGYEVKGKDKIKDLLKDCDELVRILTSIVKTSQTNS